MEGTPGDKSKKTRTWGLILLGIGGLFVLAGVLLWVAVVSTSTFSDGESDLASNLVCGGVFCFGPPAFLGAILAVIGGVLWYTNREPPL